MAEPSAPRPAPATGETAPRGRAEAGAQSPALRLARKTQSLDILYEIATCLSQPGSLEQLLHGFLDTFIELVDARAARDEMNCSGCFHMVTSNRLAGSRACADPGAGARADLDASKENR